MGIKAKAMNHCSYCKKGFGYEESNTVKWILDNAPEFQDKEFKKRVLQRIGKRPCYICLVKAIGEEIKAIEEQEDKYDKLRDKSNFVLQYWNSKLNDKKGKGKNDFAVELITAMLEKAEGVGNYIIKRTLVTFVAGYHYPENTKGLPEDITFSELVDFLVFNYSSLMGKISDEYIGKCDEDDYDEEDDDYDEEDDDYDEEDDD
jgi:hypothetical protein